MSIPAREINVLVHGDSHSGKSWLAGAIVERLMAARYAVCLVDPEGDYRVLSRMRGMSAAEVRTPSDVDEALGWFEADPMRSVILDLSDVPHTAKAQLTEHVLAALCAMRRRLGRPHWIVVDEAHHAFHPEACGSRADDLARRGFCLVTYRASQLGEGVVRAMDVFLLARTTSPPELEFVRTALPAFGDGDETAAVLQRLRRGQFLLVRRGPEGVSGALTFVAAPRQTVHVRHRAKYVDSIVPPGAEFFFRRPDGAVNAVADSLQSFRQSVAMAPEDVLAHHAGHGDFSRWVGDVFQDAELARQLRKAETRWRRGELAELRRLIAALIIDRYGGDE